MEEPTYSTDTKGAARWRAMLLGCVAVMAVILVGWTLRATAPVVVPVVFSIFLALLVAPVDRWGTKRAPEKFPWLGHVAAMGTIFLALLGFLACIGIAAQQVVERFPLGSGEEGTLLPSFSLETLIAPDQADNSSSPDATKAVDGQAAATDSPDDATAPDGSSTLSRLGALFDPAGSSLAGRIADWASGYATAVLSAAGTTLAAAVLVFFLTLMMLVEGPRWRKKIAAICSRPTRKNVLEAIGIIADRLRNYIWARTILGVMTAVIYVAWLWMFGVDLLIVWALLAFALNFIPTLGSLIAGILPVLYAFAQKDVGTALIVGVGILVIEQVMGNYVDPRMQGRKVSLSPVVVLIVLLFWGWIWGVAGAVLAVPMTIAIAVISAHVPPLRPLAFLLGNDTDMEEFDDVP